MLIVASNVPITKFLPRMFLAGKNIFILGGTLWNGK
jgi:hypothetical protein